MKIIFFGTSAFAVPALEALIKSGYEIVTVITTPDEPSGRKQLLALPPVKLAAQKLGLKILQPKSLKTIEFENDLKADLGIVASYGKIIPAHILQTFKRGLINIHPSLLPKYRGSSPIQSTLLNGEEETGVTIMQVDEAVDHGPILSVINYQIPAASRYQELHDELAKSGAELLIKTIPDYVAGKIKPMEQDHSQATFTKMIKKEDGQIDWHSEAKQIYNQFRAFHVWPQIYTTWQEKILKITNCKILENKPNHGHEEIYIGKIHKEDGVIYVSTAQGHLQLLRVQLEGSKDMDIQAFLSGHLDFIGSQFS